MLREASLSRLTMPSHDSMRMSAWKAGWGAGAALALLPDLLAECIKLVCSLANEDALKFEALL